MNESMPNQESSINKPNSEDTELFKSNFRSKREEEGFLDLKEESEAKLEILDAPFLKKARGIVQEMREIYKKNYKNYPPEFFSSLMENFDKSFDDKFSHFYLIKDVRNNKLIAFCRVVSKPRPLSRRGE